MDSDRVAKALFAKGSCDIQKAFDLSETEIHSLRSEVYELKRKLANSESDLASAQREIDRLKGTSSRKWESSWFGNTKQEAPKPKQRSIVVVSVGAVPDDAFTFIRDDLASRPNCTVSVGSATLAPPFPSPHDAVVFVAMAPNAGRFPLDVPEAPKYISSGSSGMCFLIVLEDRERNPRQFPPFPDANVGSLEYSKFEKEFGSSKPAMFTARWFA